MKPDIHWLDDPEVFRVNQLPAHSDHPFYGNYDELLHKKSRYIQSLDGEWAFNFAATPADRDREFYQPDFDAQQYDTIAVPGHIELNDYGQIQYINTLYPWEGKQFRRPAYSMGQDRPETGTFSDGEDNSVGMYRKTFTLNESLQNQRVIIQFLGVERAMYVWLNGHFIGYAEDSFTPSEFDLTPYLTSGENLLAVAVFKHSTASYLEDQDMFRFSGIFRSVNLIAKPELHLEDLTIRPIPDENLESGNLNLTLNLSAATAPLSGSVTVTVFDHAGHAWVHQTVEAHETVTFTDLPFDQIHLWDHHHPYLYQLQIQLLDAAGNLMEVIPYRFGFRRVEIKDHVLLLNNDRLVLNGVNRHEWNDQTGRAITLADMRADMQTFHDNHINAVRTCHYPDQIPWYDMCDDEGIYMMAETNLETHGTWQKMGAVEPSYNVPGSLPQWQAAVLDRAKSNYETFKNHTAILFWSLGNESYAGEDIQAMNTYYKTVDPDRLTHYEGVCRNRKYTATISDVESMMYAAPKDIANYLEKDPQKPFLNCEFMHDMGNSLGGLADYMNLIQAYPSYAGGFIWDFIDQALLVPDEITKQPVLRYGGDFDDRHSDYEFSGDGLLFADRTPKPAMQEVRYEYGQFD
ncbi:glycoside hydrolase family 2 TIM barrel-domain containing protein [Levilactobacillus bambusae]|uniref:beta-galactosidase n=1 Tax=Levilactobacillus bambusae TaxID=2024736 RepID=A0A2V1MYW4_9LACO|nr:glycoside hydrolase family 2 TIM barrel-domain containing protein [Levilactobacillus bambusae]PWF99677.1 beta-galactosidase [Levilactobacillus bambusae]